MRLTALALTAALGAAALPADAAPIEFAFNAGPATLIVDPSSAFTGFSVGEDILFSFSIDSATPDATSDTRIGRFVDPEATVTLTGLTRGASVTLSPGLIIEFNGLSQVSILGGPGSSIGEFGMPNDVNLRSATPFITDANNLSQSLAELQTSLTDGIFTGFTSTTSETGSVQFFVRPTGLSFMVFGPVGNATTPVGVAPIPLPAGGVLLLTGLGAVAALRRRRRAA